MRLAVLAQRHSIHTVRWVNGLAGRGHEVVLLSATRDGDPLHPDARFQALPFAPPAGYFLNVFALRRLLTRLRPDLLHAHFASGYGTLASLAGFAPTVLSVWGSDVYDFPDISPLHQALIRANLARADAVCSTSEAMARRTERLHAQVRPFVVPFGIDVDAFAPDPRTARRSTLTIGTVKTLTEKYGVDLLIRAFALLRRELVLDRPELAEALRLRIVGGGPDEAQLHALAREEGVADVTYFEGHVPHERVREQLLALDIYVALSRRESFGVAVLEASACGLPVVVTEVGGLPEVVEAGVTGFVVPGEDANAAAVSLRRLVTEPGLRASMGAAGRRRVVERYAWAHCLDQMERVYAQVLERRTDRGGVEGAGER